MATSRRSLPNNVSTLTTSSNVSLCKRSSLFHSRVRSLDSLAGLCQPTVDSVTSSWSVSTHSRVRSLDAGKLEPIRRESLPARFTEARDENNNNQNHILSVNLDSMSIVLSFLDQQDILSFCVGSARQSPHLWITASQEITHRYHKASEFCAEAGLLTEIASQGQAAIREEVGQVNDQLKMMMQDQRRFQNNEARFEVDFQEIINTEKTLTEKYRVSVGILQDTMTRWNNTCKSRDHIATFAQRFHQNVRTIWYNNSWDKQQGG